MSSESGGSGPFDKQASIYHWSPSGNDDQDDGSAKHAREQSHERCVAQRFSVVKWSLRHVDRFGGIWRISATYLDGYSYQAPDVLLRWPRPRSETSEYTYRQEELRVGKIAGVPENWTGKTSNKGLPRVRVGVDVLYHLLSFFRL
jgi:hypothetical protein